MDCDSYLCTIGNFLTRIFHRMTSGFFLCTRCIKNPLKIILTIYVTETCKKPRHKVKNISENIGKCTLRTFTGTAPHMSTVILIRLGMFTVSSNPIYFYINVYKMC